MKAILTPIDFSEVSDAVVQQAALLARSLDGRVVLFHVVQPPTVVSEYASMMDTLGEISAAAERTAERRLVEVEEKLKAAFVPVERAHAVGLAVNRILQQAERCEAAYMVMGSHGHGALYDLMVGSTTHGVLLRAKCPVMIVPSAKRTAPARKQKGRQAVAV